MLLYFLLLVLLLRRHALQLLFCLVFVLFAKIFLTNEFLNTFSYQSTLKQLFEEFENGEQTHPQLASVTMRIMQALQTNLDGKSKQYKDPALTHLFLMNNIHYMVRSVRRFASRLCSLRWFLESILSLSGMHDCVTYCIYVGFRSEAKDLLGDDWVQRHRRIVQQHANQYKRIAWAKVYFC